MAHAHPTPAKGDKQPAFPTPDELRAFFFLLRDLGWKPGSDHPSPPPSCPPPKGTKLPTKAQVQAVFALAREMGWMSVNPDEHDLIIKLRRTTYHGRNVVKEVANAIARDFPWRDGSPYNTRE